MCAERIHLDLSPPQTNILMTIAAQAFSATSALRCVCVCTPALVTHLMLSDIARTLQALIGVANDFEDTLGKYFLWLSFLACISSDSFFFTQVRRLQYLNNVLFTWRRSELGFVVYTIVDRIVSVNLLVPERASGIVDLMNTFAKFIDCTQLAVSFDSAATLTGLQVTPSIQPSNFIVNKKDLANITMTKSRDALELFGRRVEIVRRTDAVGIRHTKHLASACASPATDGEFWIKVDGEIVIINNPPTIVPPTTWPDAYRVLGDIEDVADVSVKRVLHAFQTGDAVSVRWCLKHKRIPVEMKRRIALRTCHDVFFDDVLLFAIADALGDFDTDPLCGTCALFARWMRQSESFCAIQMVRSLETMMIQDDCWVRWAKSSLFFGILFEKLKNKVGLIS